MAPRRIPFATSAAALALLVGLPAGWAALAAFSSPGAPGPGPIPPGAVGHDISWPQCGHDYPEGGDFGIVGVTGGRPYTRNPCLGSQFEWAEGRPGDAAFYMNTSSPGPVATALDWYAQRLPDPGCSPENEVACAYDYGFNAAAQAWAYAEEETGAADNRMWWLDVETLNSWSDTDLAANVASLRGTIDFLHSRPGVVVGIYSAPFMWQEITGGARFGLPAWVAGAHDLDSARAMCGPEHAFTGGAVVLVQWVEEFDLDYVC